MTAPVALADGLLRLRAPNPSPLTGTGTNTYLLGQDELAVVDPGPDLPQHLAAILAAADGRPIRQILVTHAHGDHSALSPRLAAATGAEVLAYGSARDGINPRMAALPGLPPGGEGLDLAFHPDRRLTDLQRIIGPGWDLQVLHTPGHLGGHLCLAWGDVVFSGDHVMGWATTIVAPPDGDMGDYMASLHRLSARTWQRFLPGHGEPVEDPAARLSDLIAHRQMRERQILLALDDGPSTPAALTARLYAETPRALWPAAQRNVLAHLIDLASRNLIHADPHVAPDAIYHRR